MKLWGLSLLGLIAMTAQARDYDHKTVTSSNKYQHKFQFVYELGIQNGGDNLRSLVNVETGKVTDSIRAGGFWQTQFGAQIPIADLPLSVQVTGGIQYGSLISNINYSRAHFKRKLLEGIVFFHWDRYRVGAGVTQHIDPVYEENPAGHNNNSEYKFDDATGLVLELGARYDQNIMVGFRGTVIDYEISGVKINANNIGFNFTYAF